MMHSTSVKATAQVSGDGEHASLLPFHWRSWCQVSYLDQNLCRYRPSHATVGRKSELQATIFDNNVILRKMDIAMSSFKIKLWKALATTNPPSPSPYNNVEVWLDHFWPWLDNIDQGGARGGAIVVWKCKLFNTLCPRYCRFRLTQCTTKTTKKNKRVIVASSPFSPPPLLLHPCWCASRASTFHEVPQWRAFLRANPTNTEAAIGGKSSREWFWKNSSQCQEIQLPVK